MRPCIRGALRWILILPLSVAGLSEADALQWTSIGPDGAVVTAVSVGPGPTPVVYAGTRAGLFRSADGGANWTTVADVPRLAITFVAVGQDGSAVYVAGGGALYKSTDDGEHFVVAGSASKTIAIDPSDSSVLYSISGRTIYRSGDGGSTWSSVYTPGDSSITGITGVAVSRGRVYAGFVARRCIVFDLCGTFDGGVLRSANGIGGWEVAARTLPIRALAVHPTDPDSLYVVAESVVFPTKRPGGVLRSKDGGASWGRIGDDEKVDSIAVDPHASDTVYWGRPDAGVLRRSGQTPTALVLPASLGISLAVEAETGRVWAGSGDGLFTSATGSDGWKLRMRGIRADLTAIAADPNSPAIYAGTSGAVWKSTNAGSTWSRHEAGLENRKILALRIDPTRPDTLFAGTDSGVFRSVDGGETWSSPGLSGVVADIAVDPRSSRVFAIGPGMGVMTSTDGGDSWSFANTGLGNTQGYSVDVDPVTSTVWVGTYGGVFRSTDGGSTWTPRNNGLTNFQVSVVRVAPSDGSTLYASAGLYLFGSTDGGASWHSLNRSGLYIAIDPVDSRTVYWSAFGAAARSADGGASLITPTGIPAVEVRGLAIGQGMDEGPSRVYAATGGGAVVLSGIPPCAPSAISLCLQDGRFQATVDWRTADGRSGEGQAVSLTRESGYFWFRTPTDVELAVKVIDGSFVNGRYWFFAGSLSGVEFTIRVLDTETGFVRTYENPLGRVSSFVDTEAFAGAASTSPPETLSEAAIVSPAPASPANSCTGPPAGLCLSNGRFQVAVRWETRDGRSGSGQAVPITADAGYFWFFGAGNVELVVKVLDGRSVNGHFWVFSGALSNVAYTITVTDTETGVVKTYENPQGRLASFADTEAF